MAQQINDLTKFIEPWTEFSCGNFSYQFTGDDPLQFIALCKLLPRAVKIVDQQRPNAFYVRLSSYIDGVGSVVLVYFNARDQQIIEQHQKLENGHE